MSAQGGIASTNAAGKGEKGGRTRKGTDHDHSEKPIELISKREFRERFCVPNDISIRLMDGGLVPTEKESFNVVTFSKEKFNVGLCFLLPSLFKKFLHFTKISPFFLHSNEVRVLMGCSILNMLFHLDLFLLEVLFIYIVKMSRKGIFSLSAHIPSLQLVAGLPDSIKGTAKGHVII